MRIFNSLKDWQEARKKIGVSETLGFVPTMGNLHPGHLSLIRTSQQYHHFTAVSIFVNKLQFNQAEDFLHYPRTLDEDLSVLKEANVDFCILPTEAEIYPLGTTFKIEENTLSKRMEGAFRPGHFSGVLTIVMKLLQLTKPHTAYFGEKDYQQYLLVKQMTETFFLDTLIHPCPTIREDSGLALSSRNNRLSLEEKEQAAIFAKLFHQKKPLMAIFNDITHAGFDLDYLEDYCGRRFIAVNIGAVRLIDNYALS